MSFSKYELIPSDLELRRGTEEAPQPIISGEYEENEEIVVQLRVQPRQLRFLNDAPDGKLSLRICLHGIPYGQNTISPVCSSTNPQQWHFDHQSLDYPIRRSWLSHLDTAGDDINLMNHKQRIFLKKNMLQATKNGLLFPYRTAAHTLQSKSPRMNNSPSISRQEVLGSLEFMLWSFEIQERVFISEYSLSLGQWALANSEHAVWPSVPFDVPLKGNNGRTLAIFELQIGLIPVQQDQSVEFVTRALQKMLGEDEFDPYHVPSTQTIEMREEFEDFADDWISDERQSNDEDDRPSGSDQDTTRRSLEALTLDSVNPHKTVPAYHDVVLEHDTEQMKKVGLWHTNKGSLGSQRLLDTDLTGDTDVVSETDMNKRSWTLRRPSSHTAGPKSDSRNRSCMIMSSTEKKTYTAQPT